MLMVEKCDKMFTITLDNNHDDFFEFIAACDSETKRIYLWDMASLTEYDCLKILNHELMHNILWDICGDEDTDEYGLENTGFQWDSPICNKLEEWIYMSKQLVSNNMEE